MTDSTTHGQPSPANANVASSLSKSRKKRRVALLSVGFVSLAVAAVWAAPGRLEFPVSVADLEARGSETFGRVDSDSSGEITREEFADAQARDGSRRPRHDRRPARHYFAGVWRGQRDGDEEFEAEVFAILDVDGDGQLSATEFSMKKQQAARQLSLTTKRFDRLDADGSGTLGMNEFPARRMQNLDLDGDGEITRQEMRNGMHKRHTDAD